MSRPVYAPEPSSGSATIDILAQRQELGTKLQHLTDDSLLFPRGVLSRSQDFFSRDLNKNTRFLLSKIGELPSGQDMVRQALEKIQRGTAQERDFGIAVLGLAYAYSTLTDNYSEIAPASRTKIDLAFELANDTGIRSVRSAAIVPVAPAVVDISQPPAFLTPTVLAVKEPLKSVLEQLKDLYVHGGVGDEDQTYWFRTMLHDPAVQDKITQMCAQNYYLGALEIVSRIKNNVLRDYTEAGKDARKKAETKISVLKDANTLFSELQSDPSTRLLFEVKERLSGVKDKLVQLDALLQGSFTVEEKTKYEDQKQSLQEELGAINRSLTDMGFRNGTVYEKWNSFISFNQALQLNLLAGDFDAIAEMLCSNHPNTLKEYAIGAINSYNKSLGFMGETLDPANVNSAIEKLREVKSNYDGAVQAGRQLWANIYGANIGAIRTNLTSSGDPITRAMFERSGQLDFMAARRFLGVNQAMQESGLAGPTGIPENISKLILHSVADLNALNPLLVPAYFAAVENLARLSRDDPVTFAQLMGEITTSINSIANQETVRTSSLNQVGATYFLLSAFESISSISAGDISTLTRHLLEDAYTIHRQTLPYSWDLKQRHSPYDLVPPQLQQGYFNGAYPFSNAFVHPPIPGIYSGGTGGSVMNEGVMANMPSITPFSFDTYLQAQRAARDAYLGQKTASLGISDFMPGKSIKGVGATELLKMVRGAFVPTTRPTYSSMVEGDVIGGGGLLGSGGQAPGSIRDVFVKNDLIGVANLVSPTGGLSFGASDVNVSGERDKRVIALGYTGDRIGRIDTQSGVIAWENEELEEGSRNQAILGAVQTIWSKEKEGEKSLPSNMVMAARYSEEADGRTESRIGWYIVSKEKDGTFSVYELRGGTSTFQPIANYLFQQVDSGAVTEGTNVYGSGTRVWEGKGTREQRFNEPEGIGKERARFGGLVAFDLGETIAGRNAPIMGMVQEVPGFEGQKLYTEWIGAAGAYSDTQGRIFVASVSGIDTTEQGGKLNLRSYSALYRKIKDKAAGEAYQWEAVVGEGKDFAGKTQVSFYLGHKYQNPDRDEKEASKRRPYYYGFSVGLSGAESSKDVLLAQDKELQDKVNAIRRVGANLYGSMTTESSLELGSYLTLYEQYKAQEEGTLGLGGKTSHDIFLYRWIFFLKSLKDAGVRIDTSRFTNLDWALSGDNINQLRNVVASSSDTTSSEAKSRWNSLMNDMGTAYKQTSVGFRYNGFSLEAFVLDKEQERQFWSSNLQMVGVRAVMNFETGFIRGQFNLSSSGSSMLTGNPMFMGYAGAGTGWRLGSDGVFDRFAADLGAMLELKKSSETTESGKVKEDSDVKYKGWYGTGMVEIYNKALTYSEDFKKLRVDYEKCLSLIDQNKVSDLPIALAMPSGLSGKAILTPEDKILLGNAVYEYFHPAFADISRKFNNDVVVTLGWGAFFPKDGGGLVDVGLMVDLLDKGGFWIVGRGEKMIVTTDQATAEETNRQLQLSGYTGFTIYFGSNKQVAWDTMLGVTAKGEGAVAMSGGTKLSVRGEVLKMPSELALNFLVNSENVRDYNTPFYGFNPAQRAASSGYPANYMVMITWTLGGVNPVGARSFMAPMPAPYKSGGYGASEQEF